MGQRINLLALLGMTMLLTACVATLPSLKTVDHVDIQRFTGDWYGIACIPTPYETEVYLRILQRRPAGSDTGAAGCARNHPSGSGLGDRDTDSGLAGGEVSKERLPRATVR